jgi:hypothetical protein
MIQNIHTYIYNENDFSLVEIALKTSFGSLQEFDPVPEERGERGNTFSIPLVLFCSRAAVCVMWLTFI